MNLFSRTIKSLSRKEKIIAGFLLLIMVGSIYSIFAKQTKSDVKKSQAGVYSEGIVGEIKHINPVYTEFSEADADISSLVFSGLVKYNPATKEFEEDMATHTLSEDQLTYTFTLKNDIFWHDGEPVTADDIYFTFATVIQDPEFNNPILKSNFDGVKIEEVDSRTVKFTLNSKNYFFFTALTVGILPKHILENVPIADLATDDFNRSPIGSGPYIVKAPYEINDDGSTSVNLALNEKYYGKIPTIKNIRFIAYPSSTELALNRDVWNSAARIRESSLGEIDADKLVVNRYELPQYTALFLNTDSDKLRKNKERLAISKAIDKVKILEATGFKEQIDTPLLALNQDDWIHVFDKSEAEGALFDSGWKLNDGDTYRTNSDGDELTLRMIRRDFANIQELQEETLRITSESIEQQLKAVGIKVVIESISKDELEKRIIDRDYDMLLYGQSLGYNLDVFSYWHSSQASESGLNLSNYQNPKADFLMESIRTTFDHDEQNALLESLAKIISEDVPAVFLYTPSYYYLTDIKLTGVTTENLLLPKDRFANIAEWKFN